MRVVFFASGKSLSSFVKYNLVFKYNLYFSEVNDLSYKIGIMTVVYYWSVMFYRQFTLILLFLDWVLDQKGTYVFFLQNLFILFSPFVWWWTKQLNLSQLFKFQNLSHSHFSFSRKETTSRLRTKTRVITTYSYDA